MDGFTFIVEFTKTLIWPVAIIVLVGLLRKPLIILIPELRRFRWKELELDFEKKIREIESQVGTEAMPTGEETGTGTESLDRFRALTEEFPPAAILYAWFDVENALREAATRYNIPNASHDLTLTLAKVLTQDGRLDQGTLGAFENLRALRNAAQV